MKVPIEISNLAQRASSVQRADDLQESGHNFVNVIRNRIANNGNSPNTIDLIDIISDIEKYIDDYETFLNQR